MSGGARAWPKGPDLRSGAVGLRGFESRPPHHSYKKRLPFKKLERTSNNVLSTEAQEF